jgi:hypothetical protein
VTEQVVDLLEAIEVEAKHRHALSGAERRFDVLIELAIEAAAVRQPRERVMVRQETNVLLGLFPRPQVAHGNGMMRPAGKVDEAQNQLDRDDRPVAAA